MYKYSTIHVTAQFNAPADGDLIEFWAHVTQYRSTLEQRGRKREPDDF